MFKLRRKKLLCFLELTKIKDRRTKMDQFTLAFKDRQTLVEQSLKPNVNVPQDPVHIRLLT